MVHGRTINKEYHAIIGNLEAIGRFRQLFDCKKSTPIENLALNRTP